MTSELHDCEICGLLSYECVHLEDAKATTVYMVVGILDGGGVQLRLGGGSSTPSSPRVYPTLAQAQRYWKDGQRKHSSKWAYQAPHNMTIRIIPVKIHPDTAFDLEGYA